MASHGRSGSVDGQWECGGKSISRSSVPILLVKAKAEEKE